MNTISLKYNPYTVKTDLVIDGKSIKDGKLIDLTLNRRLQVWLDKFLIEMFKTYDAKNFELSFVGTELDYEDVKEAVANFHNENPSKKIVLDESCVKPIDLNNRIQSLIELYEDAKKGPFEEFRKDKTMQELFDKALAPEFEVHVIATMSSGKSTFINALLGKELMPAANEATTATIARITDRDGMTNFKATRFNVNDEKIGKETDATLALMQEWNSDENTSTINIEGDIPAIYERPGVRLVLIDTPGPNNSRNAAHYKSTVKAINGRQPSMIIYVLNATQLGINDDKNLIKLIRETMGSGGREANDRFVFVVNKIDAFDPEKGESVTGALTQARNYLNENGIQNPIIIPASAELAKLIRLERYANDSKSALSRAQRGNLATFTELFTEEPDMNMVEHAKASISRKNYIQLTKKLEGLKQQGDDKGAAEILSGIPIVEVLLDDYIFKHAIPSRLKDAQDSFATFEAQAELLTSVDALIDQSESELKLLVSQIDSFNKDEARLKQAQGFRKSLEQSKFVPSDAVDEQLKDIDLKLRRFLNEMEDELVEEELVDEREANSLIRRGKRQAEECMIEIEELLSQSLENEAEIKLDSLRQDYEQYVAEVCQISFPDTSQMGLKKFITSSVQLPDNFSMLQRATQTETKRVYVGTKTKRHGFLWLKKRSVDIYENRTFTKVNMEEVFNEFRVEMQQEKMARYAGYNDLMEERFTQIKQLILSEMDQIDDNIKSIFKSIKIAQKDQGKRKAQLEENRTKKQWYENFRIKLDAILAI